MCMTITDKYIDPFTDFGFKHIFGTEENKRFLISFLNDLLELDDKIIDIEYRNLEKLGLSITIFDVYCTDEKNNNFIVQIQRSNDKYFKEKSIFYSTFPIQEQSQLEAYNYNVTKIYSITILENSNNEDNNDKFLRKVKFISSKNKEIFYDRLTYYYLEMSKFRKTEKELSTHLDYWLYYLNNIASMTKIPEILKKDELIEEAFEVAEFLALDKDKQFEYQQDLKARWDNKACLDFAEETGVEKGLEMGKEVGKKEREKEIAKSLLDVLDIETIALKTGLSIEEIERLNQKISRNPLP